MLASTQIDILEIGNWKLDLYTYNCSVRSIKYKKTTSMKNSIEKLIAIAKVLFQTVLISWIMKRNHCII